MKKVGINNKIYRIKNNELLAIKAIENSKELVMYLHSLEKKYKPILELDDFYHSF